MDQSTLSFSLLLLEFRGCFRIEVYRMFRLLVCAWVVCQGQRTISRIWESTGLSKTCDHSAAFRFFSQAGVNFDEVGRILLLIIMAHLIVGMRVWFAVDDTLCYKRGSKVAFGGIFLDAVLSTKKHKIFRFGNNWVLLTVLVQLPFRQDRWFAIPILWRVYAKKKKGDKSQFHETKPELASEMIKIVAKWVHPRKMMVVGDVAYTGKAILKELPENADMIGPLCWNAALYQRPSATGRKKKGDRLPTPKEILSDNEQWPSVTMEISFPKGSRTLEVKVIQNILWYGVMGERPVQIVLIRDPQGEWRDECLLCTALDLDAEEIITGYCRRWAIEVAFHDAKQYLGFHDPQVWCKNSVERAAPMAWVVSSLVLIWYAIYGQDAEQAHRHRPWYRHKKTPTFADMLATLRLELLRNWLGDPSADNSDDHAEFSRKLDWLLEYIATAA